MKDSIEAVREIICVLDDLILMAKLDRAPIRAVSILVRLRLRPTRHVVSQKLDTFPPTPVSQAKLERAKAEAKACLDKFERPSRE
jgi:hypothetical protein